MVGILGELISSNTIMRRVGPSPLWEHFIAFIAITECPTNRDASYIHQDESIHLNLALHIGY